MARNWKRMISGAKRKSTSKRFRFNSETTTTGTISLTDSSNENALSLSNDPLPQKLKKDASGRAPPLASFKEARVVLEDLIHGDLLSQHQRRQLLPKRRRCRASSVTSDRTKKCVKKLLKEQVEWMQDWTSSSVESLSGLAYYRQSEPKRDEITPKREKKEAEKLSSKENPLKGKSDQIVAASVNDDGKKCVERPKPKRSRGRPRKTTACPKAGKNSVITIRSTSSNSSCRVVRRKKATNLANGTSERPKINDSATNENLKNTKKLSKKKKLKDTLPKRSLDKSWKSDKKMFSGGKERTDEKFDSPGCRRIDPSSSKHCDDSLRQFTAVTCESNIAKRAVAPNYEDTKSIPLRSEDRSLPFVFPSSTEQAHACTGSRENDYLSYINCDVQSEKLSNLHPFLQPLEKKVHSLDSIERAIEKDLAAGNNLASTGDGGILGSFLMGQRIDIDHLTETLNDDRCGSTLLHRQVTQYGPLHESPNATFNVRNASVDSSGSPHSLSNGKRKLPEIVQDDLLPRGTIDIAPVRSNTPPSGRKRRRIDKKLLDAPIGSDAIVGGGTSQNFSGISHDERVVSGAVKNGKWQSDIGNFGNGSSIITDNDNALLILGKSQIESSNITEKSGDAQLSGTARNWTIQPKIAAFLGIEERRDGAECSNVGWEDALNNNGCGHATKENEWSNVSATYALAISSPSFRPTCSSHSNLSDEHNAMAELLSSLDDPHAMDNPYDKLMLGNSERRRKNQTAASSLPDQDKKLDNSGKLRKADDDRPKVIEKLTKASLDRFNNAHGVEDGRVDSGSMTRRKRRWLSSEQNANDSFQNDNKIKLIRTHWANGENCTVEKVVTSSVSSNLGNLPKRNETRKDDNALIKYPMREQSREIVSFKKNDSTTCSVQASADTSGNNNFRKPSSSCATARNHSEDVSPGLPGFGASSIYDAKASPSSSSSASSSSTSSSSSGSSSGSASSSSSSSNATLSGEATAPNDQKSECTRKFSRTTVDRTLEDEERTKSSELAEERKVPACSETIEASLAIEDTETMEAIKNIESALTDIEFAKYQRNGAEIADRNIDVPMLTREVEARVDASHIGARVRMKKVDAEIAMTENVLEPNVRDRGLEPAMTELVSRMDVNGTMSEVGVEGMNVFAAPSDDEDLEELCDAETLARIDYSVAATKENDDEEDCISLFTESLCMSRCASPARPEPSKRRASPVVQEPYVRMKSANYGKFVAENNRECEATLQAYEDIATNAETAFPSERTKESLFPLPTTTNAFKTPNQPTTNNQKEAMPDLRTTLTSRIILRDTAVLFRGQCFAWLKIGSCRAQNNCRFKHSLKPVLQTMNRSSLHVVEQIISYAIKNRYSHFIGLVQNDALVNMTAPQVFSLYCQLYRNRLLAIVHIENTIEALRQRGLSLGQILAMLLRIIDQEDTDNPCKVLLAVHEKLQPGTCWDIMESLLSKVEPPVQVVRTIVEDAVAKKCTVHANAVYEKLVKRISYQTVAEIPDELWQKYHALRMGKSSAATIEPPSTRLVATSGIASPESPRPDQTAAPVAQWVASIASPVDEAVSPRTIPQTLPAKSRRDRPRSLSSYADTNYTLHPIDKLPPARCPYRDKLWKFHLDLQGIQEALRHHDYGHVISILSQYAEDPHRMPHIEGFYNILCKEITLAKHHMVEIVRRTVQSGVSDALRLYVYDLGIYVVTKLTNIGAWIHAYELIKTFEVFGQYNTCGFTLLAAQVYIANRRPSKALDLLEQSRIVCTNERKWRLIRCHEDEKLRITVMDSLLYALCNGYSDDAFRLLDFVLRDQCSSFKPIDLMPHVERIARRLLSEKRAGLIVDLGHLILQAKLFVSAPTFRSIINCVFHDDQILAKQLHRYATWLGTYTRAKINCATCAHMIINTSWTEEETFLMITSLIEDLYENIGHAVDRLKVRDLNVFLIFEVIPTERQLATDICEGPKTNAVWNKHRVMLKNVLDRFDPKIKIVQRSQGRVCKLQSRSLVNYLKSGQIRL